MSVVTDSMIVHCFDTIISDLKHVDPPKPEYDTSQQYGIFVTWKIHKRGELQLRGCIGCLVPIPLTEIEHYARESAFNDFRFDPIKEKEIPSLQCSVSLLHSFEDAKDYKDWEVGKHGIRITFHHGGRAYRATYLPEVAPEQGWDQETTIRHLIEKAGCSYDASILPSIQLQRYQTEKRTMQYEEYVSYIQSKGRHSLLELPVCG
ncbi:hypothetical protein BLSTO_04160 [Blastocystis sp. subtype 1]